MRRARRRGLPALTDRVELYAAVHRGVPGDLAFYRRVCAGSRSVLELGCGYGRVLAALSDGAWELTGIDHDADMLQAASARLPEATLIRADMASFDLGQRFDRILIPHSGLWCLDDDEAVARALARVAEHLEPNGLLAFDVWNPEDFHSEARPEDYPVESGEPLVEIAMGDVSWRVWESSVWDREARRLVATYVYRAAGRELRTEIVHHYLLRADLEAALRACGLSAVEWSGSFRGDSWRSTSEHTVVLARPGPT